MFLQVAIKRLKVWSHREDIDFSIEVEIQKKFCEIVNKRLKEENMEEKLRSLSWWELWD